MVVTEGGSFPTVGALPCYRLIQLRLYHRRLLNAADTLQEAMLLPPDLPSRPQEVKEEESRYQIALKRYHLFWDEVKLDRSSVAESLDYLQSCIGKTTYVEPTKSNDTPTVRNNMKHRVNTYNIYMWLWACVGTYRSSFPIPLDPGVSMLFFDECTYSLLTRVVVGWDFAFNS